MEVEIEYSSRPGLRIVPHLMDGKLVWVRGFNGIGKTLAATMLEIATGGHEFERKSEYESLRSALEYVDIIINITDDIKIKIQLTPTEWTFEEETNKIHEEHIGNFYLNEEKISYSEFNDFLKVKIVKGNETLSTQIQEMLHRNLSIMRDLEERTNNSQNVYLKFIRQLQSRLHISSIDLFKEKLLNIKKLESELSNLRSQREESNFFIEQIIGLKNIDDLITLRKAFEEGKLQNDLTMRTEQITKLEEERDSLTDKRDLLRSQIRDEITQRKREYNFLVRRYDTLEINIREDKIQITEDLQKLSISVDVADVVPLNIIKIVEEKQFVIREEENECRTQKSDIILKRQVHETADNVRRNLVYEEEELRDEVIAEGFIEDLSHNIELTIGELRDLLTNRILVIKKILENSNVKALDDRLRDLYDMIRISESIIKDCKQFEKNIQDLDSIKKRLNRYETGISESAQSASQSTDILGKEIEDAILRIRIIRNQIQDITEKITEIEQMPPLSQLVQERKILHNALREQIDPNELLRITHSFIQEQKEKTKNIDYKLYEIEANYHDIKRDIDSIDRRIERAISDLSTDNKLSYLLNNIDENETSLVKLETVQERLRAFLVFMDEEMTEKIGDISIALDEMLTFQRGQDAYERYSSPDIGNAIEEIFNSEFIANYGKPEYMRHVFTGFKKILSFDLKNNEISLEDEEGNIRTRPLSAFSSGEKAFAFALAMISLFSQEVATHKILFLDEFGALLDFVKETALLDELNKEVFKEEQINKVVILLPVKEDISNHIAELQRILEFVDDEEKVSIQERLKILTERKNHLERYGYYQYHGLIT